MKFLQPFTWNGTKWYILSNKYIAVLKAYRLEITEPGLRFVVIYMRTVMTNSDCYESFSPFSVQQARRSQTGLISSPGRSHVNAKRRNVWRLRRTHEVLSLSRSHVNTPQSFHAVYRCAEHASSNSTVVAMWTLTYVKKMVTSIFKLTYRTMDS